MILAALLSASCLVPTHAVGSEYAADERLNPIARDFSETDPTREDWHGVDEVETRLAPVDAEHGDSLIVPVEFPANSTVWRGSYEDPITLCGFDRRSDQPATIVEAIRFDVYIPEDLPAHTRVQARLLLKHKDGYAFSALGRRYQKARYGQEAEWVSAQALHPGWNTVHVDLAEGSTELTPLGHEMTWSRYFLSHVSMLGIAIQGDKPYAGEIAIDNMIAYPAVDRPQVQAVPDMVGRPSPFAQPLSIVNFQTAVEKVTQYETATFTFNVNRPFYNPFRQNEIAIDAEFAAPGGERIRVPAFYYQEFQRRLGSDAEGENYQDTYEPVGPGVFKVRFTPRQAGRYVYRLSATYRSPVTGREETHVSQERVLAVTPGEARGFVRVSQKDPRCFEFENGEFFFPLGHSFRSPQDPRHYQAILHTKQSPGRKGWYPDEPAPKDRGLRVYEETLPRMKEVGCNAFEVWMASWWLGLEWTARWKHYHGLGRYNQVNAYKLDMLIDLAEAHGQYIHLVIDNHGKAAEGKQADAEFQFSPYFTGNGGFLRHARDLFTDEDAKAYYRDKLRYIAARWGYATHVYGMEMWSELNLTGAQNSHFWRSGHVHRWHQEMTAYLRSQDHGRHPLTTHYSGDYKVVDMKMVALDCIDYICCDAYHDPRRPLLDVLTKTNERFYPLKKPFMVTEYGGNWNASSPDVLAGDLYGGLWISWTSNAGAAPFFWWFEWLSLEKLYHVYTPLAKFIAGEDKRRGPHEPKLTVEWRTAFHAKNISTKKLRTAVLGDGEMFYVYVHDIEQISRMPFTRGNSRSLKGRRIYEDVELILPDIRRGRYAVEIWNCWTGEIVETLEDVYTDTHGHLELLLPRFVLHCALKIRRAGADDREPDLFDSYGDISPTETAPTTPKATTPVPLDTEALDAAWEEEAEKRARQREEAERKTQPPTEEMNAIEEKLVQQEKQKRQELRERGARLLQREAEELEAAPKAETAKSEKADAQPTENR